MIIHANDQTYMFAFFTTFSIKDSFIVEKLKEQNLLYKVKYFFQMLIRYTSYMFLKISIYVLFLLQFADMISCKVHSVTHDVQYQKQKKKM